LYKTLKFGSAVISATSITLSNTDNKDSFLLKICPQIDHSTSLTLNYYRTAKKLKDPPVRNPSCTLSPHPGSEEGVRRFQIAGR
jgi:hypothetical protein